MTAKKSSHITADDGKREIDFAHIALVSWLNQISEISRFVPCFVFRGEFFDLRGEL